MSDAEKDKDVTCFTVDGVVAEMVIEVEESQRTRCDDLTNSPFKDNFCDKRNDPVNVSNDAIVEEKENQIIEKHIDEENKENSIEIIKEGHKNNELVENKESEEKVDYVVENTKSEENVENIKSEEKTNCVVEDKKCDEIINQNSEEDKMSDKINDQSVEETKFSEINEQSIKNNLIGKQKRKSIELIINSSENDSKYADMPRYPEVKKRKTEINSKENEEIKDISKNSVTKNICEKITSTNVKESDISKESEKTILNRTLRNRKTEAESEKSDVKQNILRKLPFRKNKDAPDVPEIKSKIFLWNGVGEGKGIKLGDIPEIKRRIQKAKSIRALYRIIYFQWPANGQDIIEEILKFNGFPFDKSSYEYTKRQSLMKIMLDKTLFHVCELLDIRKGDKLTSIKNILEFLLKPYAKVDPATDPFWQPVVLLEKIELDKYFDESPRKEFKLKRGRPSKLAKKMKEKDAESSFISPARSTRSSAPRKIELIVIPDSDISKKSKENAKQSKTKLIASKVDHSEGKSATKRNTATVKGSKVNASLENKKTTPASEIAKTKTSVGKDEKSKIKDTKEKSVSISKNIKLPPRKVKSKAQEVKNNMSNKLKKKRFNKRRKKISSINNKKLLEKKEISNAQSKNDSDEYEIEMTVDSGPDIDENTEMKDNDAKELKSDPSENTDQKTETEAVDITKKSSDAAAVSMVILSDSSETESAEETKLVTSKKASKVSVKRKGKPLRHFTKISDSIQNANFSALQRLHILLFGASDKAENLKSNILSFGGFPFLEGSDEWKQKHFLLSLLAQNNLREYLNLLCIPYVNDDQPTMINKLMRFLAVPSEESLEYNKIQTIETEVVSSVLVDKSSPVPPAPAPKGKGETKKKVKKKEEKKVSKRPRKILMSEEEARRLEANFAREQRALAREKKFMPFPPVSQSTQPDSAPTLNMHNYVPPPKSNKSKPPITDPDQLNALLQTVYKRRALKAAGAIISTPNKGQKTKLGDIENIKFLIVTSNLNDLEILHRLIYMLEASKSRIRKNILDFDGFGFNEDSPKYKHRMDYLNSLGYEASKRISFLLGLCPLNTNIVQNDLNELIMYFLMSPCKKTVPITQMPSEEPHIIVKSTVPLPVENSVYIPNTALATPMSLSANSEVTKKSTDEVIQHSTPVPKTGNQKAKKTFPSYTKIAPMKKVLLPPSQSPVLGVSSLGNKSQKMTLLNSIPAVPSYSLPKTTIANPLTNLTLLNGGNIVLNAPKSPINSLVKVPVNPGSNVQIVNQSQKINVTDSATQKIPVTHSNVPVSLSNVSGPILHNQLTKPQISNNNSIQSSQVQPSLFQGAKMLLKPPAGVSGSPQEFIVQQQTPDGQQKVFKLIRLTSNHPLVSNVSNKPIQQTVSSPPQVLLTSNAPLPGGLPPGVIIMKSTSNLPQLQNLQLLPNTPVKFLPLNTTNSSVSSVVSSSQSKITLPQTENIELLNEKDLTESANTSLDNSMETLSSLDDNPPSDEDLFSSIQEVILNSNFEDITLRNVIERVAAEYPNHDLTHRHNYMKECVKKIIIGT